MMLGVAALVLVRSAVALGLRPSGELPPRAARGTAGLSGEDLLAGGRDADEEDDFDTWYFEHAGDERPNQRDQGRLFGVGLDGPEKLQPESSERFAVAQASQQCRLPSEVQPTLENGVIVYLVTRPMDLDRLKQSVALLHTHFLRRWAYDVKVFIPSDALRKYDRASYRESPEHRDVRKVMREVGGEGYDWDIVTFDIEFPKVLENATGKPVWKPKADWKKKMNSCAQAVSTGYKHMNQFFIKAMFEHPALDAYRYYLRIDADFFFINDVREDPFCMMAKTGRKFMWQTRKTIRDPSCSEGFWEWFLQYQVKHSLTPKDPRFFRPQGALVNYVGYAVMGDLKFFRSEPVRRLAGALNSDGRIYLNRWSDQTYYVLLLALFENHTAVGDIGFGWSDGLWCHKKC
jgi:hypothetical protein